MCIFLERLSFEDKWGLLFFRVFFLVIGRFGGIFLGEVRVGVEY